MPARCGIIRCAASGPIWRTAPRNYSMRELSDFTISDWTAAVIISIGVIVLLLAVLAIEAAFPMRR